MKRFIITCLVLAGTAALSHAQVARTDSAAQACWAEFNQAHEHRLNVVWAPSSGRFSKMLGTTRSFGRTPGQAVSNFIEQESSLLGLFARGLLSNRLVKSSKTLLVFYLSAYLAST